MSTTGTIRVITRHHTTGEVFAEIDDAAPWTHLTDAAAVTIASWWQTPSGTGRTLAGFASDAPVDAGDLFQDVLETYAEARSGVATDGDLRALRMLALWVSQHSTGYEADYPAGYTFTPHEH